MADPKAEWTHTVNFADLSRGLALQFKKIWPENFKAYAAACRRHEVQAGHMFVFETGLIGNPRYIINFPTKRHWREKSRIEDIEAGLGALAGEIRMRRIRSIAIPALGAGLGGLFWEEVCTGIECALRPLIEVQIVLYKPREAPAPAAI